MKTLLSIVLSLFAFASIGEACSMYKITRDGKTIVGNNEDWLSINTQMWFVPGTENEYGVMNVGFLNNFAQGGINEAGLMFDGFAMPYMEVKNTEGKIKMPLGKAVQNTMKTCATVREAKAYLSKINLSALGGGMIVFVDRKGEYLVVEGDEFILGNKAEEVFSNFYPSQTKDLSKVEVAHYQKGMKFVNASTPEFSVKYCTSVMSHLCQKGASPTDMIATQYSTIYDLETLSMRFFHYNNFDNYVEINLMEELKKGEHRVMIPELFPESSLGYQNYLKWNNKSNPTQFIEECWQKESAGKTGKDLEGISNDYASFINVIGYEWLDNKSDSKTAALVFKYGTEKFPDNSNLYDSYGQALYANGQYEEAIKNYEKSVALNPENTNGIEMIEEIKSKMNASESEASDLELITQTCMDYIEGTANGDPERIRRAFHEDLNLYSVDKEGGLSTRSGQKYISFFEDGEKRNRIGSITSIDFENDAAMAKIKVVMPDMKRIYTDYLLLLKLNGQWKIIHKSYTFETYPD